MKDYNEFNINVNGKHSGTIKTKCPKCPPHKSSSDSSKDLSVNLDKGIWNCHRCGWTGTLHTKKPEQIKETKVYKKPLWTNKTDLSENVVKFFEERCISQQTLINAKITEQVEFMPQVSDKRKCICFNYFRENELINIKFRDNEKNFKLFSGAELIFYNLDSIKDYNYCIITEGEIDCLTYMDAGFIPVVSVPNGANNNLQYLDNCYEYFENKEKIYIATDNDSKGIELRTELIRRLGAERCLIVTYDDCKDINDYKKKWKSNIYVQNTIETAQECKVDGIFKIIDVEDEVDEIYLNGLKRGLTVGINNLDNLITWQLGTLCIVTGIPSHGKSEVIDEIIVRLNMLYGLKACYFSPENFPFKLHIAKLISKITGKEFNQNELTRTEYIQSKQFINENFSFIYPKDEQFTIDNILEKALYSVKKHGTKIMVIDPFNRIEHQLKSGESETNYISRVLDKMTNFAQRNNVLFILMAHPRKINKNSSGVFDVPTLYDINGSANFYNKAFYGLTIYRIFNEENPITEIHVQKVKMKHLGGNGTAQLKYNIKNGRYCEYIENEFPQYDYNNYLSDGIEVQLPF